MDERVRLNRRSASLYMHRMLMLEPFSEISSSQEAVLLRDGFSESEVVVSKDDILVMEVGEMCFGFQGVNSC